MRGKMAKENDRVKEILDSLMVPGETIGAQVVESRFGGAKLLEPAHVFATNKRILIIRQGFMHAYQDFKIINYNNITEIILENRMMFSRMHFTLQGETAIPGEKKWLVGLNYKDALALVRFVNSMLGKPAETGVRGPILPERNPPREGGGAQGPAP